jgi:hypothetical protein
VRREQSNIIEGLLWSGVQDFVTVKRFEPFYFVKRKGGYD